MNLQSPHCAIQQEGVCVTPKKFYINCISCIVYSCGGVCVYKTSRKANIYISWGSAWVAFYHHERASVAFFLPPHSFLCHFFIRSDDATSIWIYSASLCYLSSWWMRHLGCFSPPKLHTLFYLLDVYTTDIYVVTRCFHDIRLLQKYI